MKLESHPSALGDLGHLPSSEGRSRRARDYIGLNLNDAFTLFDLDRLVKMDGHCGIIVVRYYNLSSIGERLVEASKSIACEHWLS